MFTEKQREGSTLAVIIIVALVCVLFYSHTEAYWEDDIENAAAIFSGAGQNGQSTLAFSYAQPIPTGWFGLYAARQTGDGEVLSETYAGHIQGGFDIGRFGIEAYVTAKRDLWQAIKLGVEAGYFGRSPKFVYKSIEFSSGLGNWSARNDNDEEIGRKGTADTSSKFGWLAFLTGRLKSRFGETSLTGRYKPSWNFEDTRVEVLGALNKEISDTWQFGISALSEFNSASVTDSDVHTSYLASFTFTPEK